MLDSFFPCDNLELPFYQEVNYRLFHHNLYCNPSLRAYVSKWWSMGFSRHDVNHFYNVLWHVIGRWLSLANSPRFGMTNVVPPENQRGYSWAPWVMAWNVLTTPCSDRASFHQKFVILSSPGALQFLFSWSLLQPSLFPRCKSLPRRVWALAD